MTARTDLAVQLVAKPALILVAWSCASLGQDPATQEIATYAKDPVQSAGDETTVLTVQLVRVGGGSERYDWKSSGLVVHSSESSSMVLQLRPESVKEFGDQLLACGICSIERSTNQGTGGGKQRLIVKVANPPSPCSADLTRDAWSYTRSGRRCLEVVRSAIRPLTRQCSACGIP